MRRKEVLYNDGFSEKWIYQLSPIEWRGRVTTNFIEVPLSQLEPAGCAVDPDVVYGWCRTLMDGRSIPPPVAVLTERGTYYLHDGNHRFEALKQFLAAEEIAMVRIAVAVPHPGHRFSYCTFGDFGTYVLKNCPRRFARTAQITTAILASAIAVGMTALLSDIGQTPFFVFFVLSVMIAAWLGGAKAGLIASLSNLLGSAYFFLPPYRSLMVTDAGHTIQLGITALAMVGVAFFMQAIRQKPSVELGLPESSERSVKPAASSAKNSA